MSFMFNPFPFDDPAALNRPELSEQTISALACGPRNVVAVLTRDILAKLKSGNGRLVIGMDGYTSADWAPIVNLLTSELAQNKVQVNVVNVADAYKCADQLDEMLAESLEENLEKDPVLLFGKLFKGGYETLFDGGKLAALTQQISSSKTVTLVYGHGSCSKELRSLLDLVLFFDITPKQAVLRIKSGLYKNLGDKKARPFKKMMRRCYYYDFELAMHLRKDLIENDLIDYYLPSDRTESIQLLPRSAFNDICASLVKYPLRAKPVYLEGIWGGHYISRLRNLPKTMKNCAWVFDLIPLEVSVVVQVGAQQVDIPYFAFVNRQAKALMGEEATKAFHGYFPIRFNYDDSWHSNGNMSIQVHPDGKYIKEHFNELGRQDESYYVVATGHGAKTYIGFRNGIDPNEFIALARQSEVKYTPVDYQKYVNHVDSRPGIQFMLPAGTIHSSGRNQVVLEIGSLTVGSYTFKMYDYLRADLDGIPRPIHTWHGDRALKKERDEKWVLDNIVQQPRVARSGDGWAEYIVGEHDLLYFSLRRYEFDKKIEADTKGIFHVLTLVDGEKVVIYSKNNPKLRFVQNYLDIVVVPANIGPYVIENLGNQPVCIHKTQLKDNFTAALDR